MIDHFGRSGVLKFWNGDHDPGCLTFVSRLTPNMGTPESIVGEM